MKKQILNLGKALSKVEQKSINGGAAGSEGWCSEANNNTENCDCDASHPCNSGYTCEPNNNPDEGSTLYGTCVAQ